MKKPKKLNLEKVTGSLVLGASVVAFICLLSYFLHLGWVGYISDSEIWSVTLAKHLREEWWHPWVFTRPVFYGVLGIFEFFTHGAIATFLVAKIVGILNGLLILFLTFRLAKRLSDQGMSSGKVIPWVAPALLLANTGFITQGYRIRSDLFACSLTLLALERTFATFQKVNSQILLTWLSPLLATPKAILQIIPFAIFSIPRKLQVWAFSLAVGIITAFLLFYPRGAGYFLGTLTNPNTTGLPVLSFQYLTRLIGDNFLIFGIFFLRFLTLFFRCREKKYFTSKAGKMQVYFAVFVMFSLIIAFLSPEKVPFFLATYLPMVSIFAALICEDFWALFAKGFLVKKKLHFRAALLACFCLVLLASVLRGRREATFYSRVDSVGAEFSSIQIIENYLNSYPGATYFDVVGLVPERASIRQFAGPNDPFTNDHTAYWIVNHPPNLIFYVEKCSFLEPDLSSLLGKKYFPLQSDVFARWETLPAPIRVASLNEADLQSRLRALAQAVGLSSIGRFSMLVNSKKNKKTQRVEVNAGEWLRIRKLYKQDEILALSAFTDFDPPPVGLKSLIHFDGFF